MLRPHLCRITGRRKRRCWRLTRPVDRGVAADAIQLAIGIDGIEIAAVAGGGDAAADRAVGERHQVDAEELSAALDLAFHAVGVATPGGVAEVEQAQQWVSELRVGTGAVKAAGTRDGVE